MLTRLSWVPKRCHFARKGMDAVKTKQGQLEAVGLLVRWPQFPLP